MNELTFFSAILIGLAGGTHCVGMCGGIVGAFSYAVPKNSSLMHYTLAYNIGRIFSYTLAGALTGWLGYLFAQQVNQGIVILQFVSSIFLLLLAFYIGGWWQGLSRIEKLGGYLWKIIQPWSKKCIPFKSPIYALPYGMIWGWLPCGLVYSVLTWSLSSGSALQGATVMAGFGLGTLPIMILMALGFEQIKQWVRHPTVKLFMAMLLLVFALLQIVQIVSRSVV
jgi:sulfite exporter TauE/SafE